MKKVKVNLVTSQDVKDFVKETMQTPFDVTVGEGKFIVDGKSIMGLFSLNLAKPVTVSYDADKAAQNPDAETKYLNSLNQWIARS